MAAFRPNEIHLAQLIQSKAYLSASTSDTNFAWVLSCADTDRDDG